MNNDFLMKKKKMKKTKKVMNYQYDHHYMTDNDLKNFHRHHYLSFEHYDYLQMNMDGDVADDGDDGDVKDNVVDNDLNEVVVVHCKMMEELEELMKKMDDNFLLMIDKEVEEVDGNHEVDDIVKKKKKNYLH